MRIAWSWVAVMMPMLLLGGCALPAAVVVASYSADVVSYAATGKTVTDHAYSAVARSDCSFIRVLRARPICVDEPDTNAKVQVAQMDATVPARKPAAPPDARNAYVTIGCFTEAVNAERALARYAQFHAVSAPITVHGRQFQRVVAGPLSRDEAALLEERLIADARVIRVARG